MALLVGREDVSTCLNDLLKRLRITPEAYDTSSDLGKGVNYTGEIIKLRVNGKYENGENVELRLILKIAVRNLSTRDFISVEQSYQCETFVYETVFSVFAKMQAEAKLENRFKSYPKYYASSTKSLQKILVLEDMAPYQVIDRSHTLNYNQARILAKEIGKFHALSFVLRKKNPKLFQEMCKKVRSETIEEDEYIKLLHGCLIAWMPRFLALLEAEKYQMVYEKFCVLAKRLDDMYRRHYSFDPEDEYGVIGHCDIWVSNLLFDEQNVCIIDWQTSRVCSPAVDLSQILFTCCDDTLRREHGKALTQAYYDSLSALLHQFGEDPNKIFPFSTLQKHLKEYSGYALCLALRTVAMLSVIVDEIPDSSQAQTYTDLVEMYRSAKMDPRIFNKRVRAILVDYDSYGYDL